MELDPAKKGKKEAKKMINTIYDQQMKIMLNKAALGLGGSRGRREQTAKQEEEMIWKMRKILNNDLKFIH